MTEADGLRSTIDVALQAETEASIAWTTLYERLNVLGSTITRIEIQELLDLLPGLKQSMTDLVALDTKLYAIKSLLEEVRRRL